MLAEILRERGYRTGAFVSSLPVRSRFGFAQGFDYFGEKFTRKDASIGREGGKIPHDRVARATTADFVHWVRGVDRDEPVFAWLHLVDPHAPYRPPNPFKGRWPKGTKGFIRRYDQEIRYADHHLGKAVVAMRHRAGKEGTVFVVTSDHGEGLGDHDWAAHGLNLYEEAVRIPLVVAWPDRLPAGQVITRRTSLLDIAPGLLSLLEIPSPDGFSGIDFLDPTLPGARCIPAKARVSVQAGSGQDRARSDVRNDPRR